MRRADDWDSRHHLGGIPKYDSGIDRHMKKKNKRTQQQRGHAKSAPSASDILLNNTFPGAGFGALRGAGVPYAGAGPPGGGANPADPMNLWAHSRVPPPGRPSLGQLPADSKLFGQPGPTAMDSQKHNLQPTAPGPKPAPSTRAAPLASAPEFTLEGLFEKAQKRLVKLWEECCIPEEDRDEFQQKRFQPLSAENLAHINDEIQKLMDTRSCTLTVRKHVENRETLLYLLMTMCQQVDADFQSVDSAEFQRLISGLRLATLDVIESIKKWREIVGTPKAQFLWKNTSYLLKMQHDLNFLIVSPLSRMLDFTIAHNPLLYPSRSAIQLAGGINPDGSAMDDPQGADPGHGHSRVLGRSAMDSPTDLLPPVRKADGKGTFHNVRGAPIMDPFFDRIVAAEKILRDEAQIAYHKSVEVSSMLPKTAQSHNTNTSLRSPQTNPITPSTTKDNLSPSGSVGLAGFEGNTPSTSALPSQQGAGEGMLPPPPQEYVEFPEFMEEDNASTQFSHSASGMGDEWFNRNMRKQTALDTRAALCIQCGWRSYRARKKATLLRERRDATITIQQAWRCVVARRETGDRRRITNAAIKIQALARGRITRNFINILQREHEAATDVQRIYRGHAGRVKATRVLFLWTRATMIQRAWRGYGARSRIEEEDHRVKYNAATSIQTTFRGHLTRRQVPHPAETKATRKIQAWWRGCLARKVFRKKYTLKRGFIALQSLWRGIQARRIAQQKREEKKEKWSELSKADDSDKTAGSDHDSDLEGGE